MRCLTLARQLRDGGNADIEFVCRDVQGHLAGLIATQGYRVALLPTPESPALFDWNQDAGQTLKFLGLDTLDWLIVDHYGIDARWETLLRARSNYILAIDDLANRPHDCDVLLDQNYRQGLKQRYDGLVPAHCKKLLGPNYVLLRPEFCNARKNLRRDFSAVRRLLVNFGGTDEPNMSQRTVDAIRSLQLPTLAVDVVIGQANPHRNTLQQAVEALPGFLLHIQTERMAKLVSAADLAIGASGSSTWERCSLGLPTLAVVLADNQREAANELGRAGIIVNLGDQAGVSVRLLADAISRLIADNDGRATLSRRSLELIPEDRPSVPDALKQVENQHA